MQTSRNTRSDNTHDRTHHAPPTHNHPPPHAKANRRWAWPPASPDCTACRWRTHVAPTTIAHTTSHQQRQRRPPNDTRAPHARRFQRLHISPTTRRDGGRTNVDERRGGEVGRRAAVDRLRVGAQQVTAAGEVRQLHLYTPQHHHRATLSRGRQRKTAASTTSSRMVWLASRERSIGP